ncbi:hypothetical protein DERF_004732 [Dermatophagoides farinae]|uniref:Uncharacterized protein n=1 Tax=Dermatophagoides farinae TaxID=6954 RepID=A0A922I4H7_DERFA|nr:hypothetical protein DERF_004732 [Dermatophagoides farinae]
MIFSAKDVIEVETIKNQCQTIFNDASMNLRKWSTSDHELNKRWNDELAQGSATCGSRATCGSLDKALGMDWTNDDCLRISIPELKTNDLLTKRMLVSFLASMYDPFRLVLATSLKLKLLIHEAWIKGHDWDGFILLLMNI